MSRATGQSSYFMPSRLSTQPDEAVTGTVPCVPLDTLVAVRDAQDATGWAADVPSAACEEVSEEALQGVGGVDGDGHGGSWGLLGGKVEERRNSSLMGSAVATIQS